ILVEEYQFLVKKSQHPTGTITEQLFSFLFLSASVLKDCRKIADF
ncbi:hypothetical protein X975_23570, partial [Stegodyphus mimosarum]